MMLHSHAKLKQDMISETIVTYLALFPSSPLPFTYLAMNSSSSHQIPADASLFPLRLPLLASRLPNTESWAVRAKKNEGNFDNGEIIIQSNQRGKIHSRHSSLGFANAGVPLNRRHRRAALSRGNTTLVRYRGGETNPYQFTEETEVQLIKSILVRVDNT